MQQTKSYCNEVAARAEDDGQPRTCTCAQLREADSFPLDSTRDTLTCTRYTSVIARSAGSSLKDPTVSLRAVLQVDNTGGSAPSLLLFDARSGSRVAVSVLASCLVPLFRAATRLREGKELQSCFDPVQAFFERR